MLWKGRLLETCPRSQSTGREWVAESHPDLPDTSPSEDGDFAAVLHNVCALIHQEMASGAAYTPRSPALNHPVRRLPGRPPSQSPHPGASPRGARKSVPPHACPSFCLNKDAAADSGLQQVTVFADGCWKLNQHGAAGQAADSCGGAFWSPARTDGPRERREAGVGFISDPGAAACGKGLYQGKMSVWSEAGANAAAVIPGTRRRQQQQQQREEETAASRSRRRSRGSNADSFLRTR
ncbi:uncharacterized protein LOC114231932 [Eptesicus fuscus]|uniref:uncharacterized protein LOC114231932 n=1 Tax=Eptesicus fuscus TaxID=29078 RepID=UPI0024043145|nr:uncharacterized protein LOC114231932 [Eptesicus fuscus]